MDLVVTKWIGLEATVMLAEQKKEELRTYFPAAMIHTAEGFRACLSVETEKKMAEENQAEYMCALESGGIFTALWKLAEEARAGMEVDLRKIPVRQETIEICEYFDLNPYNILSGGSLLAAVPQGAVFVDQLKREGIEAVVIGRLTNGNDRILWNDGNKRFLDRPQREELQKLDLYPPQA